MKNKILVVAHYVTLKNEWGYNRFIHLCETLSNDYDVTLITSSYSHLLKSIRDQSIVFGYKMNLVYINEPGYKNNISLKRYYSHYVFAKNVTKYLNDHIGEYKLIYLAIPSVSVAYQVARVAMKYKIQYIIDVQDVWPQAFKMFLGSGWMYKLLTANMLKAVRTVYESAQAVITVSDTYSQTVRDVTNSTVNPITVYIGGHVVPNRKSNFDILEMVYIGSLSYSYDIVTVVNAMRTITELGINNVRLTVIGHGNQLRYVQEQMNHGCSNITIKQTMPYEELMEFISGMDVGIHCLLATSHGSITNKFSDYCCAGLAVLNSCTITEVIEIVYKNNLGINYTAGDSNSLVEAVLSYCRQPTLLSKHKKNSYEFAVRLLDRNVSYLPIATTIRELLQ